MHFRPLHAIICAGFLLAWGNPGLFAQQNIAPTAAQTAADQLKSFKLPPGFEAQLVATDPDIGKPMQLAFDPKGRIWVTTSVEYPFAAQGRPGKDKLYILSDIGADGKAKTISVFADELNIPIGILPLPDGKSALVSSIDPGDGKSGTSCWIWKLTDTDGDGKADKREKLYGPFGTRDTHGMVNSFTLMPDGWIYACHGFSNESVVKGKDGQELRMQSGNTFRFRADGSHIEIWTRGQVNPFGLTYDPLFNFYTSDCHSKPLSQLIRGCYHQSFGKPHDGLGFAPDMLTHDHGSTGLCGPAWYAADHFPAEYQGTMFLCNVVTNRINFDKIEFSGASPRAIQKPDFMTSTDPWFRPVDIKVGLDGALYISDFYNKIIGHYEVDLKHPGRDHTHGRIWRVIWKGLDGKASPPQMPRQDWLKASGKELVEDMGHPNLTVRMMATLQMIHRPVEAVEISDKENAWAHANRMWVAFGTSGSVNFQRKDDASTTILGVHELKVLASHAKLNEAQTKSLLAELQNPNASPEIRRALYEAIIAHPHESMVPYLTKIIPIIGVNDTHSRHAARIALRECLKQPKGFAGTAALNDNEKRQVADIALGVPSTEAAEFLSQNLLVLKADRGKFPLWMQHIVRYSATEDAVTKSIESLIQQEKSDLAFILQVALAYQRGAQQAGKPLRLSNTLATSLVQRGLESKDAGTLQAALELAGAWKPMGSFDALLTFIKQTDRPETQRSAALVSLVAIDSTQAIPVLVRTLTNANESIVVREKSAQTLATMNRPEAFAELAKALESVPARLQTTIAIGMASTVPGAEKLFATIASGKASARLLQENAVRGKLNDSKAPKYIERVNELTKGLPTADQKMLTLIKDRSAAFNKAKPDAALGAVIFKNQCNNCHQLAGQGAKVGPQLDGIGSRGLDRLLEDILDPNRNVDQALRSTTVNLKDGKILSGLILREEGETVIMSDPLGKEIRIAKGDIEERRPSLLSPMPANFSETLKEEEFYHLMAFLLTQRPKE